MHSWAGGKSGNQESDDERPKYIIKDKSKKDEYPSTLSNSTIYILYFLSVKQKSLCLEI